jgi:hypothetical protein
MPNVPPPGESYTLPEGRGPFESRKADLENGTYRATWRAETLSLTQIFFFFF